MTRRKTRNTRASLDAIAAIERLKKSTGMTSAEILDDALKNYSEADTSSLSEQKAFKQSVIGQALETPWVKDAIAAIPQINNDEKLRKQYRAEFRKDLQDDPRYIRLDNTKPPNVIIDAAIVSLWRDKPGDKSRKDVLEFVIKQMQAPTMDIRPNWLSPTWATYPGTSKWFDSHTKYKGKFELTVNNRINALIRNQILEPVKGSRGMYKLFRNLLQDEWDRIDGIQKLTPQRGIVIPNFWKRTRLVA